MRVLIADDEPTARIIGERLIASFGYETVTAVNGAQALEILTSDDPPRLAVIDWEMPEMDGVEVCRKLHERDAPLIYIILLTSRTTQQDMVEALEHGAHDFQTKPVDKVELRCRLQVGARLIAAEDKLHAYARNMETLANERAKQLVHADRMATLGTLSAGIAHEINNPTSFISGNIRMIEKFWDVVLPCMKEASKNGSLPQEKLDFVIEEFPKAVAGMHKGVTRIKSIVNGLKTYVRQGGDEKVPCNLADCVASALELCANSLKYHVTVEQVLEDDLPVIYANAQQIEQVLINLLTNAADSTESKGKGHIRITAARTDTGVNISIEDDGPGIPPDVIEKIWNPFFTTKAPGKGTGLGLSIIHGIIDNHDGTIEVENKESGGARFLITLPKGSEQ